jgi:hypothetical protein
MDKFGSYNRYLYSQKHLVLVAALDSKGASILLLNFEYKLRQFTLTYH